MRPARAAPAAAGLVLVLALLPAPARAGARRRATRRSSPPPRETRLAYVVTGLAEVDEISQAGLEGLSLVLNRRTAVEAGEPRAVDLAVDDLDLFPLLYWPIPSDHPQLGPGVPRAARRLSPPGRHDPVRYQRRRA